MGAQVTKPIPAEGDIAIVGMAAHLPGAADINEYWNNLAAGVESIQPISREDLLAAGEDPVRMTQPNYVAAAAKLAGVGDFDAEFFGFSPKEAAILDPQHRHFLEVAWEALENAGHPPEAFPGSIGVYAGCGMGSYFYFNLCSNRDLVDQTGLFLLRHTGNDKDFLSTRVSHVLDLKGPSINVQTACSTSLVAVHFGVQALLRGECDMALCGGVTIELPQGRGYLYTEGEILSPDGHCHAFDHRAQGTVFGSGAGCVVLRRASDAIRDGDHIWAIIKGSAINNDGAAKAGYLAPSVDGQARCIAQAQAVAGVTAETISYVECHGTGTYLGDPIEIAALTEAFRETSDTVASCRVGSVKTNIGHLDTAAGVASLIKVALALHHRQIPATLGYDAPNPAIDFDTSPFRVNDRLRDWQGDTLRAGVNSLGVGGTNAHAVLESAPNPAASDPSDWPFQPLVISARSRTALNASATRLADHLRARPDQPLADVAFTLKQGRRAFEKRRVLVAETHAQAADLLSGADPHQVFDHDHLADDPEVVFMFPGGGAQYAGMARDLYQTEPVFADWMDRGLAVLQPRLDQDIKALWLPAAGSESEANIRLKQPSLQLPLIMITEYALAQLFISWGCNPSVLIGHSMGENTAACLAGVLSFEDCITLVHLRGQLFDSIAPGGMLSVQLSETELLPWLDGDLDLASVNGPGLCVVSGPDAALADLGARLTQAGIDSQRIAINIAAHSRMLEPILDRFRDHLRQIALHPPQIPVISNRSGLPLTAAQATDPDYWVQHLRRTVLFAQGMQHLTATPRRVYVEMGPGRALTSLARANGVAAAQLVPALRHPDQRVSDDRWHMITIARLWACGVPVDWGQIWAGARRRRVPLPGYAFQRKPYFIEAAPLARIDESPQPVQRLDDITGWGWQPAWIPAATGIEVNGPDAPLPGAADLNWLVFLDEVGLGQLVTTRLRRAGAQVTTVRAGDIFGRDGQDSYIINPEHGREGYDLLIADLVARGQIPDRVAHFWLVTDRPSFRPGSSFFERNMEQGFHSLLFLAQSLAAEDLPSAGSPIHLTALTSGAAMVRDEALPDPEKATVLGPVRVMGREVPGLSASTLDIQLPPAPRRGPRPPADLAGLSDQILEELLAPPTQGQTSPAQAAEQAALRGPRRYRQILRPVPLEPVTDTLPEGAHLLFTGGFGDIALHLAEDMIRRHRARITLVARAALPDRENWDGWLADHPGSDDPTSRRILALRRMEALGGAVLVAQADVCNLQDMRAARDLAIRRFGPVHTLIHAAGVLDDGPLLTRTPAQVQDVLAPKVLGTRVLDEVFPDGSLAQMVLFSSTSTAIGPAGQVDYVAANEYLNAFARARRGGRTRVTALNWGIWGGIGMAARAFGVSQTPAAQTLATQAPLPSPAPMLDSTARDARGQLQYHADYDLGRWFLDGHRTMDNRALVPGTGIVEIAAEALRAEGIHTFELQDIYFLRPLDLDADGGRRIRATLRQTPEGRVFELQSALTLHGRSGWQLVAQARVLPAGPRPESIDPMTIAGRCPQAEVGQGLISPQERHLRFGPRWRVLNRRSLGSGEGLAHLALPAEFRTTDAGFILHPALLDMATGWAMDLIAGYAPDHLWVPVSYARITLYQSLGAEIISHIRNAADNHATAPTAVFDITLATRSGEVCAEIKGFTIRRLQDGLTLPPPPAAHEVEFDPVDVPSGPAPQTPAQKRLHELYSQGIRPAEGAEAFARALGQTGPQIFVSSLDLPALIARTPQAQAQAEHPTGQGGEARGFDRPDLDTECIAPRNEVERRLAEFWKELLGLSQVGVEDDFFALGGHSLIAVRLFARVKAAFRTDFPISILFEAPTIAACAALISDRTGMALTSDPPVGDAPKTPTASPPRPQRFTHLVAMHDGAGRDDGAGHPKTPIFIVAGMFGNVLNLRHMARLMGNDHPFYGLQARGLFGDESPHATLADAARDYIFELRKIQPHGPYLLGGFSGGGLTAWEMARQLTAAGEKVALLILLDTPLPMRPGLSTADRVVVKLAELREKGPRFLLEWLRNRWAWQRRRHRSGAATRTGPRDGAEFHNARIESAFRSALPKFLMSKREADTHGATVLLRPPLDRKYAATGGKWISAAKEYVFADNDLGQFAPDLQVIEVPGDHDSMVLEPNVRVLTARLREVIAALPAAQDAADPRASGPVNPGPINPDPAHPGPAPSGLIQAAE